MCLIRQYRHAAGGWIWELPAGKLEPNEPPLEHRAARADARRPAPRARSWRSLGPFVSSPGVFTEVVHLFLAGWIRKMSHEAGELIEVHWIDWRTPVLARCTETSMTARQRSGCCARARRCMIRIRLRLRRHPPATADPAPRQTDPLHGSATQADRRRRRPGLSLEDTLAQKMRGVPIKSRTGVVGYNSD